MIAGFIGGLAEERRSFARDFCQRSGARIVIYVCPKALLPAAKSLEIRGLHAAAFEDLTRTETWIRLASLVGPETALVMENVTRYPKITSDKVLHLQRLAMQSGHRCFVDALPFTLDVTHIYTPWSYLDRSVLGFAHWYAFREGYMEQGPDGKIVSSHDFHNLARKIRPHCSVGTTDALLSDRRQLVTHCVKEEAELYAKEKERLFDEETNPVRIVTQLGDLAHGFRHRMQGACDALREVPGRLLMLTNLASYATKYRKLLDREGLQRVEADSFRMAGSRSDLESFDGLVYAEHPIAPAFSAFDVEAGMRRDAVVYNILGPSRVETYLEGRFDAEVAAIRGFTAALREELNA